LLSIQSRTNESVQVHEQIVILNNGVNPLSLVHEPTFPFVSIVLGDSSNINTDPRDVFVNFNDLPVGINCISGPLIIPDQTQPLQVVFTEAPPLGSGSYFHVKGRQPIPADWTPDSGTAACITSLIYSLDGNPSGSAITCFDAIFIASLVTLPNGTEVSTLEIAVWAPAPSTESVYRNTIHGYGIEPPYTTRHGFIDVGDGWLTLDTVLFFPPEPVSNIYISRFTLRRKDRNGGLLKLKVLFRSKSGGIDVPASGVPVTGHFVAPNGATGSFEGISRKNGRFTHRFLASEYGNGPFDICLDTYGQDPIVTVSECKAKTL